MNEKYLKKVLSVEAEAQAAYDQAVDEVNELPVGAEDKVNELLEKTRKKAEVEAARLIAQASDKQMIDKILWQSEQEIKQEETRAAANFLRAIDFVVQNVLGRSNPS
jgi:DNA-binding FadR family transcriptional regulator